MRKISRSYREIIRRWDRGRRKHNRTLIIPEFLLLILKYFVEYFLKQLFSFFLASSTILGFIWDYLERRIGFDDFIQENIVSRIKF